jgi:hypothetical protein
MLKVVVRKYSKVFQQAWAKALMSDGTQKIKKSLEEWMSGLGRLAPKRLCIMNSFWQ